MNERYERLLTDTRLVTLLYIIGASKGGKAGTMGKPFQMDTKEVMKNLHRFNEIVGADVIIKGEGNSGIKLNENYAGFVNRFSEVTQPLMDELRKLFESINVGSSNVRIHVSELLMSNFFLKHIKQIENTVPGLTLDVTIAPGAETENALVNGNSDVAVIFGEQLKNPNITSVGMPINCSVVAVCTSHNRHPLAARASVTPEELLDYNLALPTHSFTTWKIFRDLLPKDKTMLYAPVLRLNSLTYLKQYVKKHDNKPKPVVAILPHIAVYDDKDLNVLRIKTTNPPNTHLHLCKHKFRQLTKPAALVVEQLDTIFKEFIEKEYRPFHP